MVGKVNEPMVAIVLPVYNVERYLEECLNSLLCQTYSNIMIFAVDDGSADGSGEILDEYGRKDRRLVVQHQKNGGVPKSRFYPLFVSMKPVVPISFGFRKRLFCYRIGNWFIRLYLKQRARHQMECHDDELANAFD